MLQKKDLARAVKLKLRRGQVGVLVAVSRGILRALRFSPFARVVKLVDTGDLKSPDHCDRAGSSPAPGTTRLRRPHATLGVERALGCHLLLMVCSAPVAIMKLAIQRLRHAALGSKPMR